VCGYLFHDFVQQHPFPALEGVCRIAVTATQRATGEAHKDRWQTDQRRLSLQGMKDFSDT
jgi:hypothetical protein